MGEHIILHSDANCFYASVEMNEHPELRGTKMAVCGSTENRHGIVLTASYPAKRSGVRTGMANWEARQSCPGLICVDPHYDQYLRYSQMLRNIYLRYSDRVEPFGMDECWIDLGYLRGGTEAGLELATEIATAVREEIGITVSIGVSFTKIFAKLGSDMKKPDAITVIDRESYRESIWPLPVSELLYVGPATTRKLARIGITTIGELACMDVRCAHASFGKNGVMLWHFANGTDYAQVMPVDFEAPIKSVGHGITCVCDLETPYEVWRVLYALSQDVSHRLLKYGKVANGVQITVKDKDFEWRQYQMPLSFTSVDPLEIAMTGFALFTRHYRWEKPVRALTIRGINLSSANAPTQIDMFCDFRKRERRRALNVCVDDIRRRFGDSAIVAASLMGDLKMAKDRCDSVTMPGLMYR